MEIFVLVMAEEDNCNILARDGHSAEFCCLYVESFCGCEDQSSYTPSLKDFGVELLCSVCVSWKHCVDKRSHVLCSLHHFSDDRPSQE